MAILRIVRPPPADTLCLSHPVLVVLRLEFCEKTGRRGTPVTGEGAGAKGISAVSPVYPC